MAPIPRSPNSTSPRPNPRVRSPAAGRAAVPVRRRTRARPSPGTSTPSARRWSANRTRWTTVASGTPSCAIGDGVLYLADEYPELGLKAPSPQATSVSLMLHVRGHRCDTGTRPRPRRPGAARAVRELRRPQRHDHRPVRPPLDAQRTGDRRRDADPARRRRLRLGVDARRRSRRRVLRSCAGLDIRSGHPSGHQHQTAHRYLSRRRPTHPVLLLCGGRPARAPAQAIVDGGGTVDELEQFDFGTLRGATDSQGTSFARIPAGRRARRGRRSMALGRARFRTSPTR